MKFFPPLVEGRLVRRYKRFLADVALPDGICTAHCPNTGAMTGCCEPGSRVWLRDSGNPKRKHRHSLELIAVGQHLVCIHAGQANQLVEEALSAQSMPLLAGYANIRREPPIPDADGRFDFLLTHPGRRDCHVEVKSLTLGLADGRGLFPDAVSLRALKHVEALLRRRKAGDRAVLLFCVMHTGVRETATADQIQPAYGERVREAIGQGVEVHAFGCSLDPEEMRLTRELPFAAPSPRPNPP